MAGAQEREIATTKENAGDYKLNCKMLTSKIPRYPCTQLAIEEFSFKQLSANLYTRSHINIPLPVISDLHTF